MHSKVVYRSLEAQIDDRLNASVYHSEMLVRFCAVAMIAAGLAPGAVQSISVKEQTPLAAGMSFGEFGPYERIVATVHFAIDPNLRTPGTVRVHLFQIAEVSLCRLKQDLPSGGKEL